MFNPIKKWIYSKFITLFGHHWRHPIFTSTAWLLQKTFGLARFNYFGVVVEAGPIGYLDRLIISHEEINHLVTKACAQYLNQGGVYLDIGANHGVLSLLAAKNPLVSVFAFEPSSRELKRFWKNLQLNVSNNINVLSYGLSDKEINQELVIYPDTNSGKNSLPTLINSGKKEVCNFIPLLNLLNDNIFHKVKLCKIDVEGQELFVLNGLSSIMDKLKHCVFIVEITPTFLDKINLPATCIYDFFIAAGFQYQFGYSYERYQWDEVFFHPECALPLEL